MQRKLDEVTRLFNGDASSSSSSAAGGSAQASSTALPLSASSYALNLVAQAFTRTDCAIITEEGDILTGKAGSPKPFVDVVSKVHRLRLSAERVRAHLQHTPATVVHVRGASTMISTYELGKHTLVALSELAPGSPPPDSATAHIDSLLVQHIDALTRLLNDIL